MQEVTMTKRRKWLGNEYKEYSSSRTRLSRVDWEKYMDHFFIGPPLSTETHSVDELKEMGMVGLYTKERI